VYSEGPHGMEVISTDGLPWVESTPRTISEPGTIEPRTIIEPRLQPQLPQLPAGAVPQEAPLPPLVFPEAPPMGSNLHPSQFGDVVVIRDLPGDAMPPLRPTVTAPEAVPVVLPNGDQLIELSSKTISLGAGDNYRSLTGEVQQFRRGWRLRYAAVDADDTHGGSVSLVGHGLERLRDGAHVRVTGTMLPAEDRLSSPRFQVQNLEMLTP